MEELSNKYDMVYYSRGDLHLNNVIIPLMLNHPNILKINSFEKNTLDSNVLMRICEEKTDIGLFEDKDIDIKKTIYEIITAIDYLHKNGISNNKLEINNFRIKDGSIKLCYFEYSTLFVSKKYKFQKHKILSDEFKKYCMPTEARNSEEIDLFKIDIWQLGLILIIILFEEYLTKTFNLENHDEYINYMGQLFYCRNSMKIKKTVLKHFINTDFNYYKEILELNNSANKLCEKDIIIYSYIVSNCMQSNPDNRRNILDIKKYFETNLLKSEIVNNSYINVGMYENLHHYSNTSLIGNAKYVEKYIKNDLKLGEQYSDIIFSQKLLNFIVDIINNVVLENKKHITNLNIEREKYTKLVVEISLLYLFNPYSLIEPNDISLYAICNKNDIMDDFNPNTMILFNSLIIDIFNTFNNKYPGIVLFIKDKLTFRNSN